MMFGSSLPPVACNICKNKAERKQNNTCTKTHTHRKQTWSPTKTKQQAETKKISTCFERVSISYIHR